MRTFSNHPKCSTNVTSISTMLLEYDPCLLFQKRIKIFLFYFIFLKNIYSIHLIASSMFVGYVVPHIPCDSFKKESSLKRILEKAEWRSGAKTQEVINYPQGSCLVFFLFILAIARSNSIKNSKK